MNMYEHKTQKRYNKRLIRAVVTVFLITAGILITWGAYDYYSWKQGNSGSAGNLLDPAREVLGETVCTPIEAETMWVSIDGNRTWFLKGSQFSAAEKTLNIIAVADAETDPASDTVDYRYRINGTKVEGDLESAGENRYTASISTEKLEPGTYTVTAVAENTCSSAESDPYTFNISYPLYVTWTIDWEGNDVKQEYLNDMHELSRKHYDFPMTHFFNPRIYATSAVSKTRADYLTNWVIDRRDTYGDSIGLHLHMYTDMVQAAGVTPHYDPCWGWSTTDGYDSLVSGYSYDDMDKILDWSADRFEENGLGNPKSFRAGGWFANETTLKALNDNGFDYDSSGRTNFVFGRNNVTSPWDLTTTTQPYRPNVDNQNIGTGKTLDLWELPNNGGDSWAFSEEDMNKRYQENKTGEILPDKRVVTYLSHPDWFYEDKPKLDGLFTRIETDLYQNDTGPVIFATLDEVYNIWSSD
jgi:hypothetical protein